MSAPAADAPAATGRAHSARRIVRLAWPVFVGQLAVLAFSTVDTILVARFSPLDLAALAVGSAAYVSVFVGLMGVVLAIGPIVGQLFGAQRLHEAGEQLHQAVWIALGLALLGSALLVFPAPFLALSKASPEVAAKMRGYLLMLAGALPASLLFQAWRGFNNAVSRPKAVMVLQLGGLAIKVPASAGLVWGVPALGVPSLGVVGCGLATLVVMWLQVLLALVMLGRDPFYRRFGLGRLRLRPPHWAALRAQLRLGVPMGLSILIEVTGFSFMAIFISRLGATPVAGHQIAANLVAFLFMMPLALSNATSTLVAQRIGANDRADARRLAWHGVQITIGLAACLGSAVYLARAGVLRLYTDNEVVIAAAAPLLAWVALFHTADAAQTIFAFVLRAWRIATVPMVIYATALWGVGLGGGFAIAFDVFGATPAALQGARGFWFAATVGLVLASVGLGLFMAWVLRQKVPPAPSGSAAPAA